MKQTIEYYYSLKIDDLLIENDKYHFIINDIDYYFVFCNRSDKELKDILECVMELRQRNIKVHEVLLNVNNKYTTLIDDLNYVLLKVDNKNEILTISEIIELNKKTKLVNNKMNLYRNNWSELWKTKIDYIENQLNEIKVDKVVKQTINYYIGLCENAIYYLSKINTKYVISDLDNIVLSHRRVYFPNVSLNFYNPLTFIFDIEVRDVAEYLKSIFFAKEDAFFELQLYLKSKKLTYYSYNMLFARLLYPSYYFDCYEDIVNREMSSEKIIDITSLSSDYENFLKKAYKEILIYAPIEKISWLIN